MEKIIPNKPIKGTVKAPDSKSYAHRYLIASALSGNNNAVELTNESDDVLATKNGIEAILSANYGKPATVECHDSGSTLRFLLPIASALGTDTKFMMSNALAKRPTEPLYLALKAHGATLKETDYENEKCIRIRDKIIPGTYEIEGNVSSQFVSGLLFALPLLSGDSTLIVKNDLQSKSYINMTISVLKQSNINVYCEYVNEDSPDVAAVYKIPGGQTYNLKDKVVLEGDWSNAAFWLTAGALSGPVTCTGLKLDSLQGDMEIMNILKNFGADIKTDGDSVTVSKAPLKAIEVDIADIPDLVPQIALLDYVAEGKTQYINTERLKYKESNRIKTVNSIIEDLKDAQSSEVINADSFGDHRIAMMAAIAACVADRPIRISGAENVNKSYPSFFDELEKLM